MKVKPLLFHVFLASILFLSFSLVGCQKVEAPGSDSPEKEPVIYWGIDTASRIDSSFYQCVAENYGHPSIAGRYLGTKEDVSFGLTREEIKLLHDKEIRILLIYNHFMDARGYGKGKQEAEKAIAMAQKLEVPEGVAIFADIEPNYPVNADFMRGWVETLSPSPYEPGLYGDFSEGSDIRLAFLEAINVNNKIADITIVWTHQPQEGVTSKDKAPAFNPGAPTNLNAWIWQYGIDADTCNIDTNLLRQELLDYLW